MWPRLVVLTPRIATVRRIDAAAVRTKPQFQKSIIRSIVKDRSCVNRKSTVKNRLLKIDLQKSILYCMHTPIRFCLNFVANWCSISYPASSKIKNVLEHGVALLCHSLCLWVARVVVFPPPCPGVVLHCDPAVAACSGLALLAVQAGGVCYKS